MAFSKLSWTVAVLAPGLKAVCPETTTPVVEAEHGSTSEKKSCVRNKVRSARNDNISSLVNETCKARSEFLEATLEIKGVRFGLILPDGVVANISIPQKVLPKALRR
jgi:hypothetical protein